MIEFLKAITLLCFSEFVGMLLQNMGPPIAILYSNLINLNRGVLSLEVEGLVGYIWVGLRNLF